MNKTRFKILITPMLLILLMIFGTQCKAIHAAEENHDVPVSYEAGEDGLARFQLQVIIIGNGSVFDGSQELRLQTSVYELKYKEAKVFRLAPDKEHHIKSVVFQGIDITDQLNTTNEIKIEGLDTDSKLVITYEKDERNPTDVGNVNTGDNQSIKLFTGTILVSGIVLSILIKKKRVK